MDIITSTDNVNLHNLKKLDQKRHDTMANTTNGYLNTLNTLITRLPDDHELRDLWFKTKVTQFCSGVIGTILNRAKELNLQPEAMRLIQLPAVTYKFINLLHEQGFNTCFCLHPQNKIIMNMQQLAQNYKLVNRNIHRTGTNISLVAKQVMTALETPLNYTPVVIPDGMNWDAMNFLNSNPDKLENTQDPVRVPNKSTSARFLELIGQGPAKSRTQHHQQGTNTYLTGKALLEATKHQATKQMNNDKARKAQGSQWKATKYLAMTVLGNECACCGLKPGDTHEDGSRVIATGDHVLPFCMNKELRTELLNIQILCDQCNVAKGHKDLTDWRTPEQLDKLIAKRVNYTPQNLLEQQIILNMFLTKLTQRELAAKLNTNQTRISRTLTELKLKAPDLANTQNI